MLPHGGGVSSIAQEPCSFSLSPSCCHLSRDYHLLFVRGCCYWWRLEELRATDSLSGSFPSRDSRGTLDTVPLWIRGTGTEVQPWFVH